MVFPAQVQRSKLRPFWLTWRVEKIFGDQNSGESRVMATILQLKVAKRRLFEKVSLERWSNNTAERHVRLVRDLFKSEKGIQVTKKTGFSGYKIIIIMETETHLNNLTYEI